MYKKLDEIKLRMKDSILSIEDKNIIEMIGKEDEESKGKKDNCLGGKFLYKMSKTKWIKEKIFLFILF